MSSEMIKTTPEEEKTLRHLLGINTFDQRIAKSYRDYYCATPNDPHLESMRERGLVERYEARAGLERKRAAAVR